jgi:hypothetical protein
MTKFCVNCKYYKEPFHSELSINVTPERCKHPKNEEDCSDYLEKKKCYIWRPDEKNKNNDCPLYQEETSFWKLFFK